MAVQNLAITNEHPLTHTFKAQKHVSLKRTCRTTLSRTLTCPLVSGLPSASASWGPPCHLRLSLTSDYALKDTVPGRVSRKLALLCTRASVCASPTNFLSYTVGTHYQAICWFLTTVEGACIAASCYSLQMHALLVVPACAFRSSRLVKHSALLVLLALIRIAYHIMASFHAPFLEILLLFSAI